MMERKLYDEVVGGNVEEVKEILRNNPGVDVNWRCEDEYGGYAALHKACAWGHDSIVTILLAHPDIDVNQKTSEGRTPFFVACWSGCNSCVRLLLKDSRVNPNEPDLAGSTPLLWIANEGYFDFMKRWIASGREIDLGKPGWLPNAIHKLKKQRRSEVASLLERFGENQEETRHAVRLELNCHDELAADVFALVVFVSDGLLQVNVKAPPTPAARFFSIAAQLPLELQMVLCYRMVGSDKEIIPAQENETAFRDLAKRIL